LTALLAALALGAAVLTATAGATATPKNYYFTWYDSKPEHGMNGDTIVVANLENVDAQVQVFFGKESSPRESFTLSARDRRTLSWENTMGGPVKVVSQNGAALIVTQRVFYQDSFNEVAAIEQGNLDTSYSFTWYDSKPANGMKGNWILIANVDTTAAQVDVYVGPNKMNTFTIQPGDNVTPIYPNLMDGPVRVVSNGAKIIASQRVLCNDGFNEVMGFPASRLDSIYFFTWYDMTRSMRGNWILIANNNDTTVHAQVFIGTNPNPRGTYEVPPHRSATPIYPGTMDGPVRVVCTDCAPGQNIMVSQRILFKDSFEEVQGTPPAGLDDKMYFGWYDLTEADHMVGNWLLIANQAVGDAAVDVYIGSAPEPQESFSIGEGNRMTPQFWGVNDGPVRVENHDGKPLLASQRVIYKNSFNELLGLTKKDTGQPLPESPLLRLYRLNTYWASLTDYNNHQLSVSMRVANMGTGTAYGASVTNVSANNGVTVTSPLPVSLGDIEGSGGFKNFVVQYNVPGSASSFRTSVDASCQDGMGAWHYYP
jgi:hypothetical protein